MMPIKAARVVCFSQRMATLTRPRPSKIRTQAPKQSRMVAGNEKGLHAFMLFYHQTEKDHRVSAEAVELFSMTGNFPSVPISRWGLAVDDPAAPPDHRLKFLALVELE
ncbi:MAG: hypothetical protein LJE63_08720 [Desulfobacteraceae bacterium]|nr:hypothetical protein [Desulfobacteraceae bacterium]